MQQLADEQFKPLYMYRLNYWLIKTMLRQDSFSSAYLNRQTQDGTKDFANMYTTITEGSYSRTLLLLPLTITLHPSNAAQHDQPVHC